MALVSDDKKKQIKKIVEPLIGKSLSEIARENKIVYTEYDLSKIGANVSGLILYVKEKDTFGIFVEERDPSVRKRFTLAHELGHYFLHKNDLINGEGAHVDLDKNFALFRADYELTEDEKKTEAEANQFAAELLMPENLIREAYEKLGVNIKALAELFFVSEQAITYRLVNLSLLKD